MTATLNADPAPVASSRNASGGGLVRRVLLGGGYHTLSAVLSVAFLFPPGPHC